MRESAVHKYRLLAQCYVPIGGGLKFKHAGQIVTLDAKAAAKLDGLIEPVGVRKPNTPRKAQAKRPKVDEPEVLESEAEEPESVEEVTSDAGETTGAVQRAGSEDRE
ncbi:hypothetical protein SEA_NIEBRUSAYLOR_43 [Mycobacterium phage NiebruSaylor]|uniref:Head-to-tail connector protein n=1 Tax=Mycobacterium phage Wildflower TaxID=3141619 RepID=A0AB38ZP00_9VIRU|nr:hypothetical protein SEA_VORRPS_43 [Mycobacterium phage Vorrps]QFP97089.1 hypothetical protein SEA_KRILI_43 [Mycobacterium phage Krili]QOC58476.1 hypothetical protein SEA_SHIDA_44 [Mycobacterium phage Shida]QOC59242.1 hypothetical protein SEA_NIEBRUSAYLOR_43 [Mycobacterium phage NiebruSaylor]QXO13416.1 hypothetical protein SEA_MURAI_44 [Mycobacterium phage Murai]UAW08394.1 hypothetical protein SEA_MORI_43 [Mycobacterium phage Mori]URM87815.1 hypothetical protein SEA_IDERGOLLASPER_44 [Mycob